jgi:hypothetical protein
LLFEDALGAAQEPEKALARRHHVASVAKSFQRRRFVVTQSSGGVSRRAPAARVDSD